MSTQTIAAATTHVPLWLKLAYTAFMVVLIPVYWRNYGPTNFLYFCDVALLITLVGMWIEVRKKEDSICQRCHIAIV